MTLRNSVDPVVVVDIKKSVSKELSNLSSASKALIDDLITNGYDFPAQDIPALLACISNSDECGVGPALEADDFLRSMVEDGLLLSTT